MLNFAFSSCAISSQTFHLSFQADYADQPTTGQDIVPLNVTTCHELVDFCFFAFSPSSEGLPLDERPALSGLVLYMLKGE